MQLHHVFVHDCKRYHNAVTVEANLMPVCAECHTSLAQRANGYDVKRAFLVRQEMLGIDVRGWYRALPLKVKEAWLMEDE